MRANTIEKFWSLVAQGSADECWPWRGWHNPHGYGTFRLDGKKRFVHRIAFADRVGPLDDALTVDHLCLRHDCCNPAHLEAVDSRTNARRGGPTHGARRQRCRAGHEATPFNSLYCADGKVRCRECARIRWARYREQARANAQ